MARILFLTYHFPTPDEPGAGRPWAEATLLRDLGHTVTVLTAGTHYLTGASTKDQGGRFYDVEGSNGMRIVKTYAPPDLRKSMWRRLLNYVVYSFLALLWGLRAPAEYVFMGTDPMFIVPVGYLLSLLRGARLVLDERDLYPDTAIALGYMRPGRITDWIEAWQNFVRRQAYHIVAATPGIKQMLIEKGVTSDKITILVNAFPPDPGEQATSSLLDGLEEGLTVLYAGGMGLANELLTIIQAAKILQDRRLPITFYFVGEGDRKAEYVAYCQQNEIQNCHFLPVFSRDEMPTLLNKVDICIHSLKADPFWRCALSSKVFDYLFYGKPVVFAGQGDIAELLNASGGGITVPPETPDALATALEKLYEAPELRDQMGRRGYQYVRDRLSRQEQQTRLSRAFAV